MNSLLAVSGLTFQYETKKDTVEVLKDISFEMQEGEFIGIVGPSGCGKSTLLSLLAGLQQANNCAIRYPHNFKIETDLGYMLQRDLLFPWLSIRDNALLGPTLRKKRTLDVEFEVDLLLEKYGLTEFASKSPNALSGGMRQRVALIRTLANKPKLLLLDEPFSALDHQTRILVSMDICKEIREQHKSMILITHDLSEAILLCDRILVLSRRPSTIRRDLRITLTTEDRTYLGLRNAPEFNGYFNILWEDMCHG